MSTRWRVRIAFGLCLLAIATPALPSCSKEAPAESLAGLSIDDFLRSLSQDDSAARLSEPRGRTVVNDLFKATVTVCAKCQIQCPTGVSAAPTQCATCGSVQQACLDAKQLVDAWISQNLPGQGCYKRHCQCLY